MQAQGLESRVQLYGVNSHGECGYCGGGPVVSYGIRVQKMATAHYQGNTAGYLRLYRGIWGLPARTELMDRGWRRSGTYFYKPVMHKVRLR